MKLHQETVRALHSPEVRDKFLDLGLAVAEGTQRWKEDRPAPKPAEPRH